MVSPRIFPMVPCDFPMVAPRIFPMVPCGFPMVPCHGAAIRRSPVQLCGLPYGAVPRRCHQALTSAALRASLWCSFRSGFFAAASSSVPRSPALQKICYWQSAQKCRFCAREERELASGSITSETLIVNVAFLQITAHVSKTQMPHNQIINF